MGTPLFYARWSCPSLRSWAVGGLGAAQIYASLGCMNPTLKPLLHFLYHILIAAVLFGAVAGVASLLWYGTEFMQGHGIPPEIYVVCYIVAELLFAIDVI